MIALRAATVADGPALDTMARAIWIETFEHSASPENIAAYVAGAYGPEGALLRDLANAAVRFQLAVEDERIVGYAKLTAPFVPEPDLVRDALQLSQLYVASDHHGRGVADRLLDWTIETARADGARWLLLTVWEENHRARRYYHKRGFAAVGVYKFSTGDQIDDDIIMRLAL